MNRIPLLSMSLFASALLMLGCARGQIKNERVIPQAGNFTKSEVILVKPTVTDQMKVTGDKANETSRVNEEKTIIHDRLAEQLIGDLVKKGFKAKRYVAGDKGLVLETTAFLFEHGSGAARALVGMGAGSSNLHVLVKLHHGADTLADFDVIATSGGRGGLISMSTFIHAHLTDASEKTVEYLDKHAGK